MCYCSNKYLRSPTCQQLKNLTECNSATGYIAILNMTEFMYVYLLRGQGSRNMAAENMTGF